MFIFRTPTTTCYQWDNEFDRNFSTLNFEPVRKDNAVVGRLSRQIENNLKAPSDFRVDRGVKNLPEVAAIRRNEYSADTSVPVDHGGVQQTRPEIGVFEVPTARTPRFSDRFGGKMTLDKYFRAGKTSRRLRDLNFREFSAATSKVKSPGERPSSIPAAQQKTAGLRDDEKLSFANRFIHREY